MKKFFKILAALILLLLIALVAIPFFYKDKIEGIIKEEINNSVNAIVDYKDTSFSLIKDFPNLKVGINNLSIDGIGEFKGIRLAEAKSLNFSLDAKKVFWESQYELKKIVIDQLSLNMIVLKNGKANYDIVKEVYKDSTATAHQAYELKLKSYELIHSNIYYNNLLDGMKFSLQDVNHSGSGKITEADYRLQTKTSIAKTDFIYSVKYINGATVKLDSEILVENNNTKFTFIEPSLKVNHLGIDLEKSIFEIKEKATLIDLAFKTKQNDLKNILSLVPEVYMTNIKEITTNGTANLSGFVKGTYTSNNYPAYSINLKVKDGYLKHPNLSEAVKDINFESKVIFSGGKSLDNTQIDIPKLHMQIADNAVDGHLHIKNPMTDPLINTSFKSNLDLNKVKNAFPLTGINELRGTLDADFKINGRLSAIETKNYTDFEASGFINLSELVVDSDSIPYKIDIPKAEMEVTPKALAVKNLKAQIGENDFQLNGKLDNYLAYFLNKDEVLKANINMHSKHINLNDFMRDDTPSNTASSTKSSVIEIPKNIALDFNAKIDKLKYKDMDLTHVNGKLNIADQKAQLTAMLVNALDGEIQLNGNYDASKGTPKSDFDIVMKKMSIVKSTNSFVAFETFAPILKRVNGKFFSNMKFDVALDNQMNPILSSLNANGDFNTNSLDVKGIEILKNIGDLLKIKALNQPNIDKIKARFSIADGTMLVKPFGFNINNIKSSVRGSVDLNRQINFELDMDVPREMLGSNPNKILEGLVGKLSDLGLNANLGDIIKMKFKITGDYNNPKIKPMIAGYEGTTQEVILQVIEDKVEEVVDNAVDHARIEAQKQADKIMALAQEQADLVMSEARNLSTKLKNEANLQGVNLIKKARNPLEKMAATVSANEINRQADKESNRLLGKAQTKADAILSTARTKADALIQTEVNVIKKD